MTLVVHAFGAYATYPQHQAPWRPADFDMNAMVRAIKRRPLNAYATIKDAQGNWRRIERGAEHVADEVFGRWAAAKLDELNEVVAVLVPVPSSSMTDPNADCAAGRLATAVDKASSGLPLLTFVERYLSFKTPMASASAAGGSRERAVIKANLQCVPAKLKGKRLILVDDVLTSGGHLRACAEVLRAVGAEVELALVAARTVNVPAADPLKMPPENLEDRDF